jgi:cytochrome b6-f complex iron-sulfur subunit
MSRSVDDAETLDGAREGRRTFLQMAIAVVATAGCSGGDDSVPAAFGDVSAGAASGLSVGSVVVVPGAPVCIARDANGVYAMTLTCTHEGCDMASEGSITASGLTCNCHGSAFDVNGSVLRGPAKAALQHFAVSVDAAGNLTAHGGTPVSASTRLAV